MLATEKRRSSGPRIVSPVTMVRRRIVVASMQSYPEEASPPLLGLSEEGSPSCTARARNWAAPSGLVWPWRVDETGWTPVPSFSFRPL